MVGPGWLTFVLLEDTTKASRWNAFSIVTSHFPGLQDLSAIQMKGKRLPVHVARMHFPAIAVLRNEALLANLPAA